MDYRIESDSMGDMKVPAAMFYGAQTARSLENFIIGGETFPPEFIPAPTQLASGRTSVTRITSTTICGGTRGTDSMALQ